MGYPYHLTTKTAKKLFELPVRLSQGRYVADSKTSPYFIEEDIIRRLGIHTILSRGIKGETKKKKVFLKRTLRIANSAKIRYAYVIAEAFMSIMEIIRTQLRCNNSEAFKSFTDNWMQRELHVNDLIFQDRNEWSGPRNPLRYVFRRYAHGSRLSPSYHLH